MRRVLVLTIVMATMLALAAPVSAKVKERQAEGGTMFTLNPTCDPSLADPATACDLDLGTGILTLTLLNPGTKTGTFKGTQLLTADFLLNVFTNEFTYSGTVVFNGRVKACGVGTVVMDVVGEGFLDADGNATFIVNDQTINPALSTLPIEGILREPGFLPTDPETGVGSGDYEGEYTCDHSGSDS
ncbi:MAG: hypothetical protein OEM94_10810 [Acidimicrobiia bacterium]|nr:hypothetical protein [Acidimicrobiia bacterium]